MSPRGFPLTLHIGHDVGYLFTCYQLCAYLLLLIVCDNLLSIYKISLFVFLNFKKHIGVGETKVRGPPAPDRAPRSKQAHPTGTTQRGPQKEEGPEGAAQGEPGQGRPSSRLLTVPWTRQVWCVLSDAHRPLGTVRESSVCARPILSVAAVGVMQPVLGRAGALWGLERQAQGWR